MTLITWASLSTMPEDSTPNIDIPHFDKVVHFSFYFGAVVLATLFVRETFNVRPALVKTLACLVISAIVYGILIELLQYYFTRDRQGDPMDVLVNSCGAFFGALVINWLISRSKGLKWKI